jgi:hypothetical protein
VRIRYERSARGDELVRRAKEVLGGAR